MANMHLHISNGGTVLVNISHISAFISGHVSADAVDRSSNMKIKVAVAKNLYGCPIYPNSLKIGYLLGLHE